MAKMASMHPMNMGGLPYKKVVRREPGCRAAACRTLKDCVCTCKLCHEECVARKDT